MCMEVDISHYWKSCKSKGTVVNLAFFKFHKLSKPTLGIKHLGRMCSNTHAAWGKCSGAGIVLLPGLPTVQFVIAIAVCQNRGGRPGPFFQVIVIVTT